MFNFCSLTYFVCVCIMLISSENEKRFCKPFKVVNSWGVEWGDDGFIWIDYLAFANVHSASSSFKVISSAMVAYDL